MIQACAAIFAAAFMSSAVQARPSEQVKPGSQPARGPAEHGSSASRFVTMAPCTAASSGGRFQWSGGHHPFQGGSGAYGDIFFGGGASSRPTTVAAAAAGVSAPGAASAAPSPGTPSAGSPAPAGPSKGSPTSAPAAAAPAIAAPGTVAAEVTATTSAVGNAGGPAPFAAAPAAQASVVGGGSAAAISVATPAAVTPEPASLLLLGTGFVAVAGMRRRATRRAKR